MPGDFFDTNILVYATGSEASKVDIADALLSGGGTISVQVLNEFVNVARNKSRLDWSRIEHFVDGVRVLMRIVPIDLRTHDLALKIAKRHYLHIYDASIVAAALLAACDTLWSEDMHDGLVIDGRLTVRNPFRD